MHNSYRSSSASNGFPPGSSYVSSSSSGTPSQSGTSNHISQWQKQVLHPSSSSSSSSTAPPSSSYQETFNTSIEEARIAELEAKVSQLQLQLQAKPVAVSSPHSSATENASSTSQHKSSGPGGMKGFMEKIERATAIALSKSYETPQPIASSRVSYQYLNE